ncbi:DUF5996 family protein [Saccharopolyspora taberi]|uniref:DUF5996 family protein n=1 Tax=Saccharopolyspora taberi TaxID=60895 RepID=A0ABN3VFE3_9PSEU
MENWPALRVADWTDTRDTLHMWTQIVGKLRLAAAPMVNHWWQVPLYVTARGLTTSAIPVGHRLFDAEFDFCDHVLLLRTTDGDHREVALEPKTVARFHAETTDALHALGIDLPMWTRPTEVVVAIPFEEDTEHRSYDPGAVHRFWGQLIQAHRVLTEFRSRFIGKVSPVHFFWGGFDLAVTRFSGRTAPTHPGGAPNCGDWVMVEGYSHEVSSCGFWPGGGEEGAFYAYSYPEPDGFATHPVTPEAAFYSAEAGQFLLPYEAVRTASDPDKALLGFLQSTYEAAANHADWDRAALEDDPARRARRR